MDEDFPTGGFSDLLLSHGRDEDVVLVDGRRRYTYAELRDAAARLVAELVSMGARGGDRVAVIGPNSFFWVAAYLAAMKLGVAVPLTERSTSEELSAQTDWVGCAAVLVDRRSQRRVAGALQGRIVLTDEVLTQSGPRQWPATPVEPGQDAALMFTSGTTSRPKAVRITHANLHANTASIIEYLGLRRDDRMLVILPLHYCFGASLLHTHLAVGASLVLCNTFTFPETAVELIAAEGCTGFAGVPSSFQLLLRASSFASRPLPTLRVVQQAGGKLPVAVLQELVAAQPGAQVFVMYGQTEATARLSYLPPEELASRPGSVGRGIPGVELSVVDEGGYPVPPGVQGEIMARGASISPGYYNDDKATVEKFPGGVLRTGDLAEVDADGYVYITGRSGEFIKSWGFRISPHQVEEAALAHTGLAAAAVVGLADPEAGETVALVAQPLPGMVLDEAELLAHLRAHLPKHMVPTHVQLVDAMPMTASGKVARARVRELLETTGTRVP